MSAYSPHLNQRTWHGSPQNRELLSQLRLREQVQIIYDKVSAFAQERGHKCRLYLQGAPRFYVHALDADLPSLRVDTAPDGSFIGVLTEERVNPARRRGMEDIPVFHGRERYEVIELAVRYVASSSELRPGPGRNRLRLPWSARVDAQAPAEEPVSETGPSAEEEAAWEAVSGSPETVPGKRRTRLGSGMVLTLGLLAIGAALFLVGSIS